jgi:hypothetical protein
MRVSRSLSTGVMTVGTGKRNAEKVHTPYIMNDPTGLAAGGAFFCLVFSFGLLSR